MPYLPIGTRGTSLWVATLLTMQLLMGCGTSQPPRFQANMVEMLENAIRRDQQQQIATALEALFGSPDEPFALPETSLDLQRVRVAAGSVWSDEGGKKFGLYRLHCAHCHGISGNGQGPTAAFLNPYPRDYRPGVYKFKSTERAAEPTAADLYRILEDGIPGTAMPSFRLLPKDEKEALVEYVRYLSMRGQMETALVRYCAEELDEGDTLDTSRAVLVDELLAPVVAKWESAENQRVDPDPATVPSPRRSAEELAASAEIGRQLFYGKKANCFSCHGETALGDGQTNDYDDWNKRNLEFAKSIKPPDPESDDFSEQKAMFQAETQVLSRLLPVRHIHPRNLRLGVYRGGRRPLDLYRRIHEGINGVPMPATKGSLTQKEVWHLVDYVRQLPFEPLSRLPNLQGLMHRERM